MPLKKEQQINIFTDVELRHTRARLAVYARALWEPSGANTSACNNGANPEQFPQLLAVSVYPETSRTLVRRDLSASSNLLEHVSTL